MEVVAESVGNVTLIHLKGTLDSASAQEFYSEMTSTVSTKGKRFLLEMSGVELIDSTGLGTLVRIYKRIIESDGVLMLSDMSPSIQEIFQYTNLDSVFQIFKSTEEAIKEFKNE